MIYASALHQIAIFYSVFFHQIAIFEMQMLHKNAVFGIEGSREPILLNGARRGTHKTPKAPKRILEASDG